MFFVSFRNFFSDNTRVRIYFFCRAEREFFFQNLTLGYIAKTLNQIIFFPPPKSEYQTKTKLFKINVKMKTKKHSELFTKDLILI
jgi:hypothetical protein